MPFLPHSFNDPNADWYVRGVVFGFLGKCGEGATFLFGQLIEMLFVLREPDMAYKAIGEMGVGIAERVIEAFERCANPRGDDSKIRMYLRMTLARLGDPVVPILLKHLEDLEFSRYPADELLRVFSESLTSRVSSEGVFDVLNPLANNPDATVRRKVATAYLRHADKLPLEIRDNYVPNLMALLDDPDEEVRACGASALASIREYPAHQDIVASAAKYGMNWGIQRAMEVLHISFPDKVPSEIELAYEIGGARQCLVATSTAYAITAQAPTMEDLMSEVCRKVRQRFGDDAVVRVLIKDCMGSVVSIVSVGGMR